jgi:hypothetical protein
MECTSFIFYNICILCDFFLHCLFVLACNWLCMFVVEHMNKLIELDWSTSDSGSDWTWDFLNAGLVS